MLTRWRSGAAAAIALTGAHLATAGEVFQNPVRLEADGKVIDRGENWGHASPCIEDLDGDGLADLLVGDFQGKFRVYKNVGRQGSPRYTDAGLLKAGGTDAEVRIYCCVGGQPRFVDLDGDGLRDMISSSYDPGHCYLFRGLADHKFAAREELKDKAGVPVRSTPAQQEDVQSFGSFYTPVDWDADGDNDLLIGTFEGKLLLRVNEGSTKRPEFAAENQPVLAGGEPLEVEQHCCPLVADWDGDGLWDLLSGCGKGGVTWFRNAGTKESPLFEKGVKLVENHPSDGYNLLYWNDSEVVPGIRSQIEVVDHNGDGKLDLLVGDFYTAFEPKPDLDPATRQQVIERAAENAALTRKYVDKLEALRQDFHQRYPEYGDEAQQFWEKEHEVLQNSSEHKVMEKNEAEFSRWLRPKLARTRGPGDETFHLAPAHGFVWLYTRK
ncbi:MAG TPA: VCBS repeat-containing protein [Pirellulales bacterium]|nr:VCBS repeat-containing protein [Pirellulales bacterium]